MWEKSQGEPEDFPDPKPRVWQMCSLLSAGCPKPGSGKEEAGRRREAGSQSRDLLCV